MRPSSKQQRTRKVSAARGAARPPFELNVVEVPPARSNASVVTLSRFRAELSRALSRRGKRMLEAADLSDQVQALEPLEAYFIVKELGVGDAAPILLHATFEQLKTFIDLDCWSGDRPNLQEIDAWLAVFAAEGFEALARA